MTRPDRITIRSYQVGFGDCFLMSFRYPDGEKHVLIDFGSTGLPDGVPKTRMDEVAADIATRSGGKLTAVVATHRHKDHISGFAQKTDGSGSGDVIRGLRPELVIQPWTEDPDIPADATAPVAETGDSALRGARAKISSLAAMHAVAGAALRETARASWMAEDIRGKIDFLGDDNLTNESAVRNLMTMGADREYLHADQASKLAALLPGVNVHVLGPPTVEQTAAVKKQKDWKDEYWHLQAATANMAAPTDDEPSPIFPGYVRIPPHPYPIEARWLIHHARAVRADQLLQLVRSLDGVMNNTSLILLFSTGGKKLLFPGDAQYENWSYALGKADYVEMLADVNLYKVGHHGSLNATPKSLWKLFRRKSEDTDAPDRLKSLMSTMPGKHGSVKSETEVPRRTLVEELRHESDLFTTESLGGHLGHDTVVDLA